jgi:ubiquinone/menaquinone biosynthesis C-methylase UbiE
MGLSYETSESIIIVSARGALLPASEITWTHPFLHEVLNRIPVDVESLIDVGCGRGIIGALVRIYRKPKRLVGIDVFKEYLDFCGEMKFYDELYECDLRQTLLRFNDKEFDVATCIEVIEHLSKNKGISLLNELERIAKMVIVTTTNGFFPQEALDNNPFQQHLSSWSVKDFTKCGYEIRGVGNFIIFGHHIKQLSFLLSRFSYKIPRFSHELLAYKVCQ